MNEPGVLTRMRLSCCWGDNLNEKELNEVVDYINHLQRENKQLKQERDKYKSIVDDTKYCINDFLSSEEYCNVDGIAIADNYNDLLKILNGCEVKYFNRDKCFAIEVEELEEGNSNEK